jgi:Glycosyl transferase family 11
MTYVLIRLAGGLGNQLFQCANGLALCAARNARLLLDTTSYRRDKLRTYGLQPFAVTPRFVPRPFVPVLAALDRRFLGRILRSAASVIGWDCVRDRCQGYDPAAFPPRGNLLLEGYWQSEKYFAGVADKVRAAYAFRDPPDEVSAAWLARIASGPSVAVHVRRGDYVTNPQQNAIYGTCGPDYYRAGADVLRRTAPDAKFFLFSDDPDWAEQHLSWPGPAEVVRHNLGRRDADDLRLMAACDHFLIANSSFSWWGAWLGRNAAKVVVAPRRWFVGGPYRDADLVPAEWLRI